MILGPDDFEAQRIQWTLQEVAAWTLAGCEYIGEVPASYYMTPYTLQLIAEQIRQPWVGN